MSKTTTTRYDVANHLRTPEEMAAYLEACLEAADGDAACIQIPDPDFSTAGLLVKVLLRHRTRAIQNSE